ncbi:MAG TPA: peptide-methionine (S)-S-oxide reductase MsrA [Povalibacter sp.]|nr:peptide-methionine (S)-S-oxide reductase MsrA [Povalibacter sp.]
MYREIVPTVLRATAASLATMLLALSAACTQPAKSDGPFPAAARDNAKSAGPLQTAVLAGGCFWGVEAVFEHVRGVSDVVSGYAGGEAEAAQYETVSSGTTGHAESVRVTFDPQQVSYGELLRIFFAVAHDPTQLNRQGPDSGTQYRSAIFYADDAQKDIAQRYIGQLNQAQIFPRAIVTRVDPLRGFYPAEAYHQDFIAHHPGNPYVVINDLPKLRNLQRTLPEFYRESPGAPQNASLQ